MQNESYVWVSLDPVHCVINFYPRDIAYKIENCYNLHTRYFNNPCILGSNFFNATIYFHSNPDQAYYQTTPGNNLGYTFKQPGYRNVKRIVLTHDSTHVEIFGKRINNEWRITNNHNDSEKTFNVEIPPDVIIYPLTFITNIIKNDEVPHEYLCSISQELMIDPVKTIDNHTYDRSSIERWFKTRNTSPLTGLPLDDITLTPHTIIRNQIHEYIRLKLSQIHNLN